jgi:hypothetical protein
MFWLNSPSTVSPISADNLARAERYLLATAGANGDFYVTIPNGVNLAVNDVVHISFPAATNGASAARLSIDGGTTWKTINTLAGLIASTVASKKISLCYDGTNWVPLDSVGNTDGVWTWVHHPNGRAECWTLHDIGSVTIDAASVTIEGTLKLYYEAIAIGHNYPFTFVAVQFSHTYIKSNGTGAITEMKDNVITGSTTVPPQTVIARYDTSAPTVINVVLANHTIGTWK